MFGCLFKGDFANENILTFCPNLLLLLGLRTLLLKCRSDSLIAGFGWLVTVNSMVRVDSSSHVLVYISPLLTYVLGLCHVFLAPRVFPLIYRIVRFALALPF